MFFFSMESTKFLDGGCGSPLNFSMGPYLWYHKNTRNFLCFQMLHNPTNDRNWVKTKHFLKEMYLLFENIRFTRICILKPWKGAQRAAFWVPDYINRSCHEVPLKRGEVFPNCVQCRRCKAWLQTRDSLVYCSHTLSSDCTYSQDKKNCPFSLSQ